MSCILFSRVSFFALAGDSRFQELCVRASVDLHGIADTLFQINVAAHRACYGHAMDVMEAETEPRVYPGFMDYLTGERDLDSLRHLLLQIDYQYAEYGIENLNAYIRKFSPLLREVERLIRADVHAVPGLAPTERRTR